MEDNGKNSEVKKNRIIEISAIVLLVFGVIWLLSFLFDFSGYVKTNNAQVDADLASVTSRVSGNITEIRYDAYSEVHAGDTLVLLDDKEFRIKVAQAEADLRIAENNLLAYEQEVMTSISKQQSTSARLTGNKANLERAEKNFERFENMFNDSAVTRNQFDQVIAQLKSEQAFVESSEKDVLANISTTKQRQIDIETAKATINRKRADLDAAELQLSYTVILAPAAGVIGEKTIQTGELVNVNQVLATIVQQNAKWVSANFKETQLGKIKIGQKVNIFIDALDDKSYEGVVKDFSPATGAKFSMVAPDNSTGNFVKITQRVPVRIEFTDTSDLSAVKPGMNATVEIIR